MTAYWVNFEIIVADDQRDALLGTGRHDDEPATAMATPVAAKTLENQRLIEFPVSTKHPRPAHRLMS